MNPAIFSIPSHRAFADSLATGLMRRHGGPTGLATGLLLIPNQRAGRAIRDAFVRQSGGGLLMPRMVTIGDPDLGEHIGGALETLDAEDPIPPAIDPLERLLRLASLVEERLDVGAAEAMRLAEDLGRTLDQLIVEEIDPSRLARFTDDAPELSVHWQKSLDQLRLIIDAWPKILTRMGRIDLADRRNRLLDQVTARWRTSPPTGFVCAAGISTSAPAVARLLRRTALLPNGMVVLAGLDMAMSEADWDLLGGGTARGDDSSLPAAETHPQFHLKRLLDRLGVARAEVRPWSARGATGGTAIRGRALAHAMALPDLTLEWLKLPNRDRRLTGLRAVEASDPAEEAQAVALALREAAETPGRTAALVTPDRRLARRVSAHLRRWGIEADDSAGTPLSATPPGMLIRAMAGAAAERFAPVALLALLKHPLVMAGEGRLAWLDGARWLDLALRGPRPPAGLDGLETHLRPRGDRDDSTRVEAARWFRSVRPLLGTIEQDWSAARQLGQYAAAIRRAVSVLAPESGWSGAAGQAASDFLAGLEQSGDAGPEDIHMSELPAILERLMDTIAVRPSYGQHPRIFIWGLLEARLQQADLMILSGLNEGSWPALPAPDPWLAPRLRSTLGLPSLERRIGLAAHDFVAAAGGPQVLVTRARRDSRSPAIASRFWLRLEAMTGGMTRAPELKAWARAIDRPAGVRPADRPQPMPERRPKRLSVTEVDRLKADPFAFYARRLLGLSRLDPVDSEPSPAWKGNAVHEVFELWMREDDCDPARLRPRAESMLAGVTAHPLMRALWHPRLMEAIDFMAEKMAHNREAGRRPVEAEIYGEAVIDGITLGGRIDRLDRCANGTLAIVDYKTGQPPRAKAIREGFALQLGLLALIAEQGSFSLEGKVSAFEYWSLARGDGGFGKVVDPTRSSRSPMEPADFIALAHDKFVEAARKWLTGEEPFTAKVRPDYAPFDEYDQLMRFDEWYGRTGAARTNSSGS